MKKKTQGTVRATEFVVVILSACRLASAQPADHVVDTLVKGGHVLDGAGNPWVKRDIGITGDRISFVGHADLAGVAGKQTIDATGLVVTPGFIDMHSHAEPDDPEGRKMLPQLFQGITTVVIGVDGGGHVDGAGYDTVAEDFARYRQSGLGVNIITYVGFNAARREVMGMTDKPASRAQIKAMQDYIERGMNGGAFGISSGLFYAPGAYAETDEVIEVAKVSGRYHGIYDTHDRDLGAVYQGIGYVASTAEGIEIGEKSGNKVIFSHFSPQSRRNYGRAPEGARLIEEARARGVDVMAAQHPYTATNSTLDAYAIPTWALAGGREAMVKRYRDPATRKRMQEESDAMLEIRGGPEQIVFTDPDPEVNGLSLKHVADRWGVTPFEAVMRIALDRDRSEVMNMELYDIENIKYLAKQDWMMTCTDGYSMPPGPKVIHPRSFGAFTKKLRDLVLDEGVVTLPYAVRGMTGLAGTFLGLDHRGLIKEGFYADINVIALAQLRDNATFEHPQRYSDGMVHVLVNGRFAIRDGKATETLAGRPIARDEPVATLAENASSRGAHGASTPPDALSGILGNSGLEYRFMNADTNAIASVTAVSDEVEAPGYSQAMPKPAIVAQASETRRSQTTNRSAGGESLDRLEDRDSAIEELIVTAQRRAENLQDVPISISAISGDKLDTGNFQGVKDALGQVAGVSVFSYTLGGETNVAIRGVSAATPVLQGGGTVGYYLDGMPFGLVKSAAVPDANVYDLDRIEVLRGPQGTLYGASSLNGVVRILTNDPNLEDFELKGRGSLSTTKGGGENYRGDMVVNIPIIEGKLGARATIGYNDLSGWIDTPSPSMTDVNDGQVENHRIKIKAQPTENLTIDLSAWHSENEFDAPNVANEMGGKQFAVEEPLSSEFDTYGVTVSYDFPAFTVSSTSSYLDYANESAQVLFGTVDFTTRLSSQVFTEELALTSTQDGAWRWSLGGLYRDAEDRLLQRLPAIFAVDLDFTDTSESYALFGEVTRSFLDGKVDLGAGLRYFEDDVLDKENVVFNGGAGGPGPLYVSGDTFDSVTPRVVLSWYPDEDLTVYSSYSQGFRSGFAQYSTVDPSIFLPVRPDTLDNYEAGAKGKLLDGRVDFDAAIYYVDWQDLQQPVGVRLPSGIQLVAPINAGSASGVGLDFAITTHVTEGLRVGLTLAWNDLTYDSDVVSNNIVLFPKGERVNYSPEYTAGISGDYVFPLAGGFTGRLSGAINHVSEALRTELVGTDVIPSSSDKLTTGQLRFSIDAPQRWTASVFVDNLFDEEGATARRPTLVDHPRLRPRTIGLQLTYQY